jgi:hypothetical protein
LSLIEDFALNDAELQGNYDVYDACSGKSKACSVLLTLSNVEILKEYDDECTTAAEMYSCGRKGSPVTMTNLVNSLKGDATIVTKCILEGAYGL